jgi:hypothetical protein
LGRCATSPWIKYAVFIGAFKKSSSKTAYGGLLGSTQGFEITVMTAVFLEKHVMLSCCHVVMFHHAHQMAHFVVIKQDGSATKTDSEKPALHRIMVRCSSET